MRKLRNNVDSSKRERFKNRIYKSELRSSVAYRIKKSDGIKNRIRKPRVLNKNEKRR